MQRIHSTLALAILLALTTLADAQTRAPKATLADRLSALRQGWSSKKDEAPEEQPAAEAKADSGKKKAQETPRVASRQTTSKQPASDPPIPSAMKRTSTDSLTNARTRQSSAQARMLRDLRSGAPLSTSKPSPRAASALSPGSELASRVDPAEETIKEPSLKPYRSGGSRATSSLARSIANDVAMSFGAKPTAENEKKTASKPAERQGAAAEPAEPAALPFDTVAEAKPSSSSVTVADDKPTKKLPLFIGDGYDAFKEKPKQASKRPSNLYNMQSTGRQVFSQRRSSQPAPITIDTATTVTPSQRPNEVLISQKMPVIVSRVSGPRSILVGREATYRVEVSNRGDATAELLDTQISIPEWAEVVDTSASLGGVDLATGSSGAISWRMPRLAPGQSSQLELKVIARSGRPIQLGVAWTHKPVDTTTTVEVKEAKLNIDLAGPEDVLFGKAQLYRLTLSNPGTGDAEGVTLHLTPPGASIENRQSHPFGVIPAGDSRSVEIELTARQAGKLHIDASATALGGVEAEIKKPILCRKAELAVDWRGPTERFAGAQAVHYFRVRNPGTAAAHDVQLTVDLPEGFVVIPTSGTPNPVGGQVTFRAGSMQPGDDRYFEIKGVHHQAGDNALTIKAVSADETESESLTAETAVTALADLKLDVLDPKGPVATGQEVTYQIRVTNRGASAAQEVRVVGLFSAGIEPHHVEGGISTINDGRVAFETINSLPVGAERTFTIYARAHEEGTHLFRAEVLCSGLDIKLAAEETTRFFQDETLNVAGETRSTGSVSTGDMFTK